MSLNPLNVLKRKLEDEATPLPKRLRLAKNLVHTHYFPTAPKERVISVWLEDLLKKNKLSAEEFRSVLGWLTTSDFVSAELKTKLVDLTVQYVSNHLQDEDIPYILNFIEDEKIAPQLNTHIQEYCLITKTILKQLKDSVNENRFTYSNRILNSLVKLYKDSKKKLEFIVKNLEGDNLEIIFDYLDYPECKNSVKNVCETLLFPMSKKSFFTAFLRTLLQKESIDELLSQKGDNIQAVLKVMSAFFTFPTGRTSKHHGFVQKFIYTFVSSFKTESQLIFAFYIMVASSLNIEQSYMSPAMKMPVIIFEGNDEKIKRTIFLNMLEVLQEYEIDISVKLTETLSGNNIHIKKSFTSFLQSLMISQLKLEGKTDKTTLQIIKTVLKLDPSLIDQKLDKILPPIMVSKKNSSQMESYKETLNCLLEILFKLSRGTLFLNQILPHLKIILEACNTEQFELQQKIKEIAMNGEDCDKIKAKIIAGSDIFPSECVEMYGKLTADLMFRQNSELLMSMQKDFEEHCLMMLEEGFVSPSIITLSHVTAAILSSFLSHNKMADASAPRACADEFWSALGSFEKDSLRRFGECCLKLNHNSQLTNSFLQLSTNVARLKLLSHNYSSCATQPLELFTSAVYDVRVLLPCLTSEQWMRIAERCRGTECEAAWDNLLLMKATAAELISVRNPQENADLISNTTKTHLIKELSTKINVLYENPEYPKMLYSNVDAQQSKLLAKILIKELLNNPESNLLNNDAVSTNRCLLSALLEETIRNLAKILENSGNTEIKMSKELNKTGFDFVSFVSGLNNVPEYFEKLSSVDLKEDLSSYLDILKQLQIQYLDEKYQLLAIFVLLALKRAAESKKTQKNVDYLLQAIFELSPKHPDIYKVFPIEYVFDFETKTLLDLVTLKIKTTNPLLITKSLLKTAVRKVKTNAEIVKILVKILLNNQKVKKENSNLEYFSDKVFQISCLILPIIAKEKRAITTSNFRSILAELQEKLYKSLLKSFKSINFSNEKSQFLEKAGSPEDSVVISENTMATLNAMEAFSLTLSKYCETTDAEDVKNLDYLWSGLEYFVRNAITSLQSRDSKPQHVESSVQLLNVVLRHMKKLESHDLFNKKDVLFVQMWAAVKARLLLTFEGKSLAKSSGDAYLDDIGVTAKQLCELVSIDGFVGHYVGDLFSLMILKKLSTKAQDEMALLTSHETAKFLWTAALKSNAIEQKCIAMSKSMYRTCKNMAAWVRVNCDGQNLGSELSHQSGGQGLQSEGQSRQSGGQSHIEGQSDGNVGETFVDDAVCEILRIDLDIITSVVLAAKKIPLNAKFIDAIFECLHLVLHIAGPRLARRAHCRLIGGAVTVLSSLLQGREELLEDRWACFLQCYRGCVRAVCAGAADSQLDSQLDSRSRDSGERLAKLAHAIEKLTQSMSKRKAHISRLAAYTVGDICSWIEMSGPTRLVRQHLENSVALLIQASDSTYAMAFLRRALAGSPGQMTMTNMYSMYKRYHKYVGNA